MRGGNASKALRMGEHKNEFELFAFTQNLYQPMCDFAGPRNIRRIEGDGRNALVAASAKFFRIRGEILIGGSKVPGIRTKGNFGAHV